MRGCSIHHLEIGRPCGNAWCRTVLYAGNPEYPPVRASVTICVVRTISREGPRVERPRRNPQRLYAPLP